MSVASTRRACYRVASFLGDVQAVRHPRRLPKRILRKFAWRRFGRLMRKFVP